MYKSGLKNKCRTQQTLFVCTDENQLELEARESGLRLLFIPLLLVVLAGQVLPSLGNLVGDQ